MTFSGKSLPTDDFSFCTDSGKRERVTQKVSRLWIFGCWVKFPSTCNQNPPWGSWMSFDFFAQQNQQILQVGWNLYNKVLSAGRNPTAPVPSAAGWVVSSAPELQQCCKGRQGNSPPRCQGTLGGAYHCSPLPAPSAQRALCQGSWDYPKCVILYYLFIIKFQSFVFHYIYVKLIIRGIILHVSKSAPLIDFRKPASISLHSSSYSTCKLKILWHPKNP